jgi:hypothetical protein
MRLLIRSGALLAAVGALVCLSVAQNPGRNAFLETSVRTTDQLVSQVRANKNIRDAYMRHFAMGEQELYVYLRTLRPVRLDDASVYTIYSVPPGGELKAHDERLKKGELVFVNAEGRPVLRARCGNPLVRETIAYLPQPEVVASAPVARPLTVADTEMVPVLPVALAPAPPVVPEEVLVEAQPIAPVTTAAQGFPLPALLALPLLGGSFEGGGGGGDNPPPIPEPATIFGVAMGAGALAARRMRKQSAN